mgnify:CR=1 FL=1
MSNLNINSFTVNKDNFFGEGTIKEPDALYKNLDNISFPGRDSIVALEYMIKLDKQEEKELIIILGAVNDVGKIEKISRYYFEDNGLVECEKEVMNYWNDLLGTVKVKTPDEALNILIKQTQQKKYKIKNKVLMQMKNQIHKLKPQKNASPH